MASINGSNGDGFTRLVNWMLGIASVVTTGGIFFIAGFAWESHTSLIQIQGTLDGIIAQRQIMLDEQHRRDANQDSWIDYLDQRIDGRASRRPHSPSPPNVRHGDDDN